MRIDLKPETLRRKSLFASAPADLHRALRRHATALFGWAFLILALSQPSALAADENPPIMEVKIASEGARPPYNYLDNNELAGFEIDLARDLCARMKVSCSFVAQDWDGLIPGLLDHQYDAIMAAMEITDEAREKIAFSKPYIRMPSAFMASRRNKIEDTSPTGLSGKAIGVESGGAHQAYVEDLYKDAEVHAYATLEEAILDLAEGRLDVVLGDKDAIADFLKTRREAQCCALIADVPRDPAYFGEGVGIGLRQQDKTLKAMFEKALDASMADGAFAKIRAKYFDFEIN